MIRPDGGGEKPSQRRLCLICSPPPQTPAVSATSRESPHSPLLHGASWTPRADPVAFPAPSPPCGMQLTCLGWGTGVSRRVLSALKAHPDLWNQNLGVGRSAVQTRMCTGQRRPWLKCRNIRPKGTTRPAHPTAPSVLRFKSPSPTFPADAASVHTHTDRGGKKHLRGFKVGSFPPPQVACVPREGAHGIRLLLLLLLLRL